jgi:parvulin-like peptidyl-prolyl cis-trans isomerase-like protein
MNKMLREPLLHFLFIGAALFVVFGLINDRTSSDADTQVVVSAGRIEQLENIFAKTWQRPPTTDELKGLVDDFVLEEIYYRQAVAMGIDRDDTVIRRRLRQKFEFLTDDMAAAAVPTDEELANYLTANAEVFMTDTTYTFEQVYINPDRPGVDLGGYIAAQLSALRAGNVVDGDSALLPTSFDVTPGRVVDSNFGSGFSANLDSLPAGEWQGPVESGLGLHLVRIDARVESTLPELSDIRPIVEREWAHEKRLETRRIINAQLLNEYDVVIEWPTEQSSDITDSQ